MFSLLYDPILTSIRDYWKNHSFDYTGASLIAQLVKNPPAMRETWVWSLGWEDPLEKGKGYPLQYSGLENSTDWIVHGVTKSRTQLSNFHFHGENRNPISEGIPWQFSG